MAKEMYDACDQAGNPLGYALVRGDPIPEGVWHLVVEVFSVTAGGRVLVTRRHPDKSWGGYWEYTGGSVLAGERPREAARRELLEETGLTVRTLELYGVYAGPEEHHVYPNGDEVYNVEFAYTSRDWSGEMKCQEGEVEDLRFFALDRLPETLSGQTGRRLVEWRRYRETLEAVPIG